MILVTGTKRSGTSMWMQILRSAGLTVLGEPFLADWSASIVAANPRGFYESPLRQGIFHATNPDPRTGAFLAPEPTREHAVKVFIPGLVRTDLAYVHRVIATFRDWREYSASLLRLYALEDAYFAALDAPDAERRHKQAIAGRSSLPPEVEWWFDNYELIRDAALRQYPIHLLAYDRLLADPERAIARVLRWLGCGDEAAACRAVEPGLRTQSPGAPASPVLPSHQLQVLDDLYTAVQHERPLPPSLIEEMNRLQRVLLEDFSPKSSHLWLDHTERPQ